MQVSFSERSFFNICLHNIQIMYLYISCPTSSPELHAPFTGLHPTIQNSARQIENYSWSLKSSGRYLRKNNKIKLIKKFYIFNERSIFVNKYVFIVRISFFLLETDFIKHGERFDRFLFSSVFLEVPE